ncbi:MAG: hypothetical protein K0S58_1573 [Nitrospira sp.]|jgi:hypothetical protein|nr:hypothetical protein [Nitrospira sp.]
MVKTASSSLGPMSRRFATILFGVSVLGLLVTGCDRAYPAIVRNGHIVPIVITTVLEDGTELSTEVVPSMGEINGHYILRQISPGSIALFASVNQSAPGQEAGKRVVKQVKGMIYRLATGDMLMTYPPDQNVIFSLNTGGLNYQPVYLISPKGVFDIPEDLQNGWQDHIAWIERVGRKLFPVEGEKGKTELPASAEP